MANKSLWLKLAEVRIRDGGMPFYIRERHYLLRLAATHRRVLEPLNLRTDQERLAQLRRLRP